MASPTLQTLNIANASVTFDTLVSLTNNVAALANKGVYIDGTPTDAGANVVILGSMFITSVNANTVSGNTTSFANGTIVTFGSNTITANTATVTSGTVVTLGSNTITANTANIVNAKVATANIASLTVTSNTSLGSVSSIKVTGSLGNAYFVAANTVDNTLYFKELTSAVLTDWANVTNTFAQNTYVNSTFAQNTFLNSEILRIENEALAFAIALG